jgi:hypothetical protein
VQCTFLLPCQTVTTLRTANRANCFSGFERAARRHGAGHVDGAVAELDIADAAFLVDRERGAIGDSRFFVQDAVGARDLAFEVAQQRKLDPVLFCEFLLSRERIDADTQDLGIGLPERRQGVPVSLDFLRSATCEGQDVECEHHVLFAAEVRKGHFVPVLIEQCEIGSHIPDLECARRGRALLGRRGSEQGRHRQKHPYHHHPGSHALSSFLKGQAVA